ncbi:MAG: hypothetical protein NC313_16410 [Butyrivibrio sp.]|nr:hypothetical protein [Butyrivibrio sp.]
MKEIMTNVSEYDDAGMVESENSNNKMIPYILGAILLIVCILCVVILWQKISGRNKTEIKTETYTGISETALSGAADGGISEVSTVNGEYGTDETERTQEEIIRQQYMANIGKLREKIESYLQSMLKTKETLAEAAAVQPDNTALKEELSGITNEITALMIQLQAAQTRINEVEESISVMNSETVTVIQENISEIEQQMGDVDNDILDIYAKISDLKTADAELQKKVDEMESSLKTSAEQNMTDVTNQFNSVNNKMQQIEADLLQHLYDAGSDTLYLYSN